MSTTFYEGQIFNGDYPAEASIWCNESNGVYAIEEIEPGDYVEEVVKLDAEDKEVKTTRNVVGGRRYQIKKIPEKSTEVLADQIRTQRDYLLSACDYLFMDDYPITEEELTEVKAYRQALRDITEQEGFPTEVVWPEKPSILK